MAKNTGSSAFRKLDVDQIPDDNTYVEDGDGDPNTPTLGPDDNEVDFASADTEKFDCQIPTFICRSGQSAVGPKSSTRRPQSGFEVRGVTQQVRYVGYHVSQFRNPPVKSKNGEVKNRATLLVLRVLTSFKASEVEKAVVSLDRDQQDLLLKYVYKGFEFPQENSSAALLVWHEKLFSLGGLGAIVRVLTDRKRL